MASENPGKQISLLATPDLSAVQYTFVTVDANGGAAVPTLGGNAVGIVQNKPTAGQNATVMLDGCSQLLSANVVAAGALVSSDAAGKAITSIATYFALAVALEAAVAGQVFKVALLRNGKQ